MVIYDSGNNELKLEIPLKSIEDIINYQNALLRILGRITVESNDRQLKEDLKTIYLLLSHTNCDKNLETKIQKNEQFQIPISKTSR